MFQKKKEKIKYRRVKDNVVTALFTIPVHFQTFRMFSDVFAAFLDAQLLLASRMGEQGKKKILITYIKKGNNVTRDEDNVTRKSWKLIPKTYI